MYDLIATFGAILLGLVSLVVLTVFLSVLRGGSGEIAYLRRKDYGLKSWATGALRKPARGATMRELEGIELKSRGGISSHKEVTDWVVIDDETPRSEEDRRFLKGHAIFTDFDEGITVSIYHKLLDGTYPVK